MIIQLLIILLIALIIGAGVVYFKFTDATIAITAGGISVLISFLIIIGGWYFAKADKLSFNEYWNGYEQEAVFQIQHCYRDSGCAYNYDCDPYLVSHTTTSTDSKGNTTTSTYYTTEYHDCPYVTEEWLFSIKTTLGEYGIARNLAANPVEFRLGFGIPNIERGIPAFWQAAKNRIDAGKPGPVTKRMQYDNYLLASDKSILNQYSDQIENLTKANLLPKVTHDIHDFYYANKAYFVGINPPDGVDKWETALSYLNSGLGTELQGDLHLVVIQGTSVQPDAYITALKAYWTNPAVFGDDAASKNSIIVALGTDGTNVTWARAITGMPLGNEHMTKTIQNIAGQPLTADAIIGQVSSEFYRVGEKVKVRSVGTTGALYRILWGLDDPATKFQRVSMSGGNADDNGSGFGYLKDEIQPSDFQQTVLLLIPLIIIIGSYIIAVWYTIDTERKQYGYRYIR